MPLEIEQLRAMFESAQTGMLADDYDIRPNAPLRIVGKFASWNEWLGKLYDEGHQQPERVLDTLGLWIEQNREYLVKKPHIIKGPVYELLYGEKPLWATSRHAEKAQKKWESDFDEWASRDDLTQKRQDAVRVQRNEYIRELGESAKQSAYNLEDMPSSATKTVKRLHKEYPNIAKDHDPLAEMKEFAGTYSIYKEEVPYRETAKKYIAGKLTGKEILNMTPQQKDRVNSWIYQLKEDPNWALKLAQTIGIGGAEMFEGVAAFFGTFDWAGKTDYIRRLEAEFKRQYELSDEGQVEEFRRKADLAIRQKITKPTGNAYDWVLGAGRMAPASIASGLAIAGGTAIGAPWLGLGVSTVFWMTQSAPGQYEDNIKAGMNHVDAQFWALTAGFVSGALETAKIKFILPRNVRIAVGEALGMQFSKSAHMAARNGLMARMSARIGVVDKPTAYMVEQLGRFLGEIGIEGAQGASDEAFLQFAQRLEGTPPEKIRSYWNVAKRGLKEGAESSGAMLAMMILPGIAGGVMKAGEVSTADREAFIDAQESAAIKMFVLREEKAAERIFKIYEEKGKLSRKDSTEIFGKPTFDTAYQRNRAGKLIHDEFLERVKETREERGPIPGGPKLATRKAENKAEVDRLLKELQHDYRRYNADKFIEEETGVEPEVVAPQGVTETPTEQVLREADEIPETDVRRIGFPSPLEKPQRVTERVEKPDVSSGSEKVEKRWPKPKREGIVGKLGRAGKAIGKSFRVFYEIPSKVKPLMGRVQGSELAKESLGKTKYMDDFIKDEQMRILTSQLEVDGVNPDNYELLERLIVLKDMLEENEKGGPLRQGYETRSQAQEHHDKLERIASERFPNVNKYIERRRQINQEMVEKAVAEGLLDESVLGRGDYFHRQVLEFINIGESGRRRISPTEQSWQKGRYAPKQMVRLKRELAALQADQKANRTPEIAQDIEEKQQEIERYKETATLPEKYDINTDFLESELTWRIGLARQSKKKQIFAELMNNYDISDQIENESQIPGGYKIYNRNPKSYFNHGESSVSKIVFDVQEAAIDAMDITSEAKEIAKDVTGTIDTHVLPDWLVDQLERMEDKQDLRGISKVSKKAMSLWKQHILLNPARAIGYNLRNITGDIDPVIGGAPGVLKYIPEVWTELIDYHRKGKTNRTLDSAFDHGVASSAMTKQEIPGIGETDEFRSYTGERMTIGRAATLPFTWWYKKARKWTTFRENILRYAAFKYYRDKLNKGETFHYGGASKRHVDAVAKHMGNDAAAAHLSRNLLGDYSNMSVIGEHLRSHHIPFFSWIEVNFKRWPAMFKNAYLLAKHEGKSNKLAGAFYGGLTVARTVAPLVAMSLYNRYVAPLWMGGDPEEELSEYDRANPHILLKRLDDGSVMLLRNTGAFGDFLENIGVNTLMSMYPDYKAEKISFKQLMTEFVASPFNKLGQSYNPFAKAVLEGFGGISTYPDVFNWRTQDRFTAVMGLAGYQDEGNFFRGLIQGKGYRARPNWIARRLGVANPKTAAISDMYRLRDQFLKNKGESRKGMFPISAFRNVRYSAFNDDYGAFKEAREEFMRVKDEDYESFVRSLKFLDPLWGMKDKDEFINEYLNDFQRIRLSVARDYASEMQVKLWSWWRRAVYEGSQEEIDQYEKDVKKTKKNLRMRAKRTRTKRQRGETFAEREARRLKKEAGRERAKRWQEIIK